MRATARLARRAAPPRTGAAGARGPPPPGQEPPPASGEPSSSASGTGGVPSADDWGSTEAGADMATSADDSDLPEPSQGPEEPDGSPLVTEEGSEGPQNQAEEASEATEVAADPQAAVLPNGEAAAEEVPPAADPYGGPGDWYVIHTYAGYENKVKTNLESRIHTMQMQDKVFDVVIPMEDVMEIKGGKKQVVQKKVFPGYLLVKMVYDNDSWYVVRNTPGVTGFVAAGTGSKPTPLSKREVEKILAVKKEEVKPQ